MFAEHTENSAQQPELIASSDFQLIFLTVCYIASYSQQLLRFLALFRLFMKLFHQMLAAFNIGLCIKLDKIFLILAVGTPPMDPWVRQTSTRKKKSRKKQRQAQPELQRNIIVHRRTNATTHQVVPEKMTQPITLDTVLTIHHYINKSCMKTDQNNKGDWMEQEGRKPSPGGQ